MCFKPSRKNQDFLFLPLPSVPVWLKIRYLKDKKVLFIKKYFLGHCQYQNKKALFTDPIFSEGFEVSIISKLNFGHDFNFRRNGSQHAHCEKKLWCQLASNQTFVEIYIVL